MQIATILYNGFKSNPTPAALDEAREHLIAAVTICQSISQLLSTHRECLGYLGDIYLKQCKYEMALETLQLGLALVEEEKEKLVVSPVSTEKMVDYAEIERTMKCRIGVAQGNIKLQKMLLH